MRAYTQTYTVTVPDEAAARSVADRLAARGHRVVVVRPVSGNTFQPEFIGGWFTMSGIQDPPSEDSVEPKAEIAAVAAIARLHGGSMHHSWGSNPLALEVIPIAGGVVHEMTQEESERIRAGFAEPVVAKPVLPPGLRCGPTGSGRKLLRAVLAAVAATPSEFHVDPDGWDDAFDVLEALSDEAMHQGTIRAHTAGAVPVFAAFATAGDIADHYAADAMNVLFQMAVTGRTWSDRPENADEAAARVAVERVVPSLPAGRCELTDFLLGALAALAGTTPPPGVDAIAAEYPARKPAVDLMHTLGSAGALAALQAARPDLADASEDPEGAVEDRALAILARLCIWEVDHARESR